MRLLIVWLVWLSLINVIADKDYEPVINKYVFEDEVNNSIDKRERHESTRVRFRRGGTII